MKHLVLLIILCIMATPVFAATFTGGVTKMETTHQVLDSTTQMPVARAKISVPKFDYITYTDENGNFDLKNINSATILSVEKSGYRPFSVTIADSSQPIILNISKSNASDIIIESNIMHLGDDNYSMASANAGYFKLKSSGPTYNKHFIMKSDTLYAKNYLVIGSIMGIDTILAKSMGQNRIINSYASPPEVYFNGAKIAEIQLNGDNQRIKLPNNLIHANSNNEVTIRTGRNLMQRAYVDYDDIEIANLSIVSE